MFLDLFLELLWKADKKKVAARATIEKKKPSAKKKVPVTAKTTKKVATKPTARANSRPVGKGKKSAPVAAIKKTRGAPIGSRKQWSGRWYVKTAQGWRYDPKGRGEGTSHEEYKKQKAAQKTERIDKIIKMAQEGKSTKEISAETGLSGARIMQHIAAARKGGIEIAKRKRQGKEKVDVYKAYDYSGAELGAPERRDLGKNVEGKEHVQDGYYQYGEQKIQIARPDLSRQPDNDYIPEALGKSLRAHQADVINLAMDRFSEGDSAFMCSSGTGAGKALPLHSKILTPSGWTTMGQIKVGDEVIAVDGKPCKVLKVFPQKGERDIYRVHFDDLTYADCDAAHLWFTTTFAERNRTKSAGKVRELKEIMLTLRVGGKTNYRNHEIPITAPVEFPFQETPLDPYLLGLLLGDGGFARDVGEVCFSSADSFLVKSVAKRLPPNSKITSKHYGVDYAISSVDKRIEGNPVKNKLRELQLSGCRSENKFVPDMYKFNSVAVRLDVLRGLMDTDGSVSKTGHDSKFYTSSLQLAQDVQFLVESLGGISTIRPRDSHFTYLGERKQGLTRYDVSVKLPNGVNPFQLPRKAKLANINRKKYTPKRFIDRVEFLGKMKAQCILIDHPLHLFLTDHCIVTHNTRSEVGLAATYLNHNKGKVLIVTQDDRIMAGGMAADAKAMGIHMKPLKKLEDLDQGDNIYVTTYRDLKKFKEKYGEIGLVVFDEAHNMKNAAMSSKAKLGMELMAKAKASALFTATPIDKPSHLEYICKAYKMHFPAVMKALGYYRSPEGWGTNLDAEETAERMDAFFASLTKNGSLIKHEVPLKGLELAVQTVKLSETQQSKYDAAVEKMTKQLEVAEPREKGLLKAKWLMRIRALLEESKIEAALKSIDSNLAEGRQIVIFADSVNDRAVTGEADDWSITEDQFDDIKELIKNSTVGTKSGKIKDKDCVNLAGFYGVAVQTIEAINDGKSFEEVEEITDSLDAEEVRTRFSSGTLKEITAALKKKNIEFASVFNSNKEAMAQVKDFQAGKIKVVITTSKSGGTGINLDDTTGKNPRTAVMVSPPFSAVDFVQIAGRVHRLTTKSQSRVCLFSTDTDVERWNKGIIANKLLKLGAAVKGDYESMSIEDMEKCETMSPAQAKKYMETKREKGTMAAAGPQKLMDLKQFALTDEQIAEMEKEKAERSAKRKARRQLKQQGEAPPLAKGMKVVTPTEAMEWIRRAI